MATTLRVTWGQRLRQLRREREMTATELAAAVGVSRQHIHQIEAGRTSASDDVRIRIAATLRVEVGEIFDYSAEAS
jgi:DNA-binding XRE family transcriptional regulator